MNKEIIRNEYKKKIRLLKNYNQKYYNENTISRFQTPNYDHLKKGNNTA